MTHDVKYRDVVILSNAKDLAKFLAKSQREMFHFVQHDTRRWGQLLYYLQNYRLAVYATLHSSLENQYQLIFPSVPTDILDGYNRFICRLVLISNLLGPINYLCSAVAASKLTSIN